MPLEPHLPDETGEPINPRHCGIYRFCDLVVAAEWAPYLEGKAANPPLIWVSGDL
jgi:hypothetical protein